MSNAHGVQTSATDYDYFNPRPGSYGSTAFPVINESVVVERGAYTPAAATFTDLVHHSTEAKFGELNPAWAGELYQQDQQEGSFTNLNPVAPDDLDNPGALEDARDKGPVLTNTGGS